MASQRNTPLRVAVCTPTCRRPERLNRLLQSLAAQRLVKNPDVTLRVMVVDNDRERSAEPVVNAMRPKMGCPLRYDVEPRPGVSHVRNRLVDMSGDVDFVAFVDDDEQADPQWIDRLVSVQRKTGGQVIVGRHEFVFEIVPPAWIAPMYLRRQTVPDGTEVGLGAFSTANVMIRKALLDENAPAFDPQFSLTGGEDSFLARRLRRRGVRFYYAYSAVTTETYPASRIGLAWLLMRSYRMGCTAAAIDRRLAPIKGRLMRLLKGAGGITTGLLLLPVNLLLWRRHAAVSSMCRITKGFGSLAGLGGLRYREYQSVHQG